MMRQLWEERPPMALATRNGAGGYREFSVLGRRFLYQPDDMRIFQIAPDAPLPEALPVQVPQFPLPAVRPQMLVLLPTLACNLRCRYCFEADACRVSGDAGGAGKSVMPEPVLRRALQLLPEGERSTIAFFGGEPLLAWPLIERVVGLARARSRACSFSLTTNGTLLSEPVARFLDEQRFSLIVSLDGPEHLHNEARPFVDGSGSYVRVLAGLEVLTRFPRLAARTSLRGTYDGSGRYALLLERVRHLNEVACRFGLGNVSVEPAELAEGCSRGGCGVRPSEALFEEYMDVARWLAEERRAGRKASFQHMDVRLTRLRSRRPASSECGAGVGYCAVTPDGVVHACHRLGCPVGDVRGGIDARLQQPWRDNRYYAREGCADCWMRNLCGGGCRVNSWHQTGGVSRPDSFGCWLTEVCIRGAAYLLSAEQDAGTAEG